MHYVADLGAIRPLRGGLFFFFSSRRRHTRFDCDWSSDVCSSDLETFIVAGDRFAIGSSREMSPAGLKGVADEAGVEIVIVCGAAMGDIFRRNALNLGLHVVQSREARSEERRVGKECRCRRWPDHE